MKLKLSLLILALDLLVPRLLCGCDDALDLDPGAEARYTGIVMVTNYDERFAGMAVLTLRNKRLYCMHQGYPLVIRAGSYLEMDGKSTRRHR